MIISGVLYSFIFMFSSPDISDTSRTVIKQKWSAQDGLLQDWVFDISQTEDGFLWFITEEGIVRFNGSNFKDFRNTQFRDITNTQARSVMPLREDTLLIGFLSGDAVLYDGFKFTHIPPPSKGDERPLSLASTQSGKVFCVHNSSLYQLSGSSWKKILTIDRINSFYEVPITVDDANHVWIGWKNLYKTTGTTYDIIDLPYKSPHISIKSLKFDSRKRLWIASNHGLLAYKNGEFTSYNSFNQMNVVEVEEDNTGKIWVIANEKLYEIADCSDRDSKITEFKGITTPTRLFQDKADSLWVGAKTDGVIQLKQSSFYTFRPNPQQASPLVHCVLNHPKKGLLYFDKHGSMFTVRGSETVHLPWKEDPQIVTMMAACTDGDTIWIGGSPSIYWQRENGETGRVGQAEGLPASSTRVLKNDPEGNLWVGSNGAGIFIFKNNRLTKHYGLEDGLTSLQIRDILFDDNSGAWIASSGGLNYLKNDTFTSYKPPDLNHPFQARSLYLSEEDSLFFGLYGGGLYRLKSGQISGPLHNADLDVIYTILPDQRDNLWLNGNRGIHKVALSQLNRYFDDPNNLVGLYSYGIQDGLKSLESQGFNPSATTDDQGSLWFATNKGLSVTNSRETKRESHPPNLVIDQIQLGFDKFHGKQPNIKSKAGTRHSVIEFSPIYFSDHRNLEFSYSLSPRYNHWTTTSYPFVVYEDLSPGIYEFKVRCKSFLDDQYSNIAKAQFEIVPVFYETMVFRLLVLFTVFFLLFMLYKIRIYSLKARQFYLEASVKERTVELELAQKKMVRMANRSGKTEMAQELMHIFGNALNSLKISLDLISTYTKEDVKREVHKVFSSLRKKDPSNSQLYENYNEYITTAIKCRKELALDESTTASKQTDKLIAIISKVLNDDTQVPIIEEISVIEVFKNVVALFSENLDEKGISINANYKSDIIIKGDPEKFFTAIRYILEYIISSLSIQGVDRQIHITSNKSKNAFRIEIQWLELREQDVSSECLFSQTFDLDQLSHLGLHYAANAIKYLGGKISAQNIPSTDLVQFSLTFPLPQKKKTIANETH